jgi:hypothetical protein
MICHKIMPSLKKVRQWNPAEIWVPFVDLFTNSYGWRTAEDEWEKLVEAYHLGKWTMDDAVLLARETLMPILLAKRGD